jgi:hypothetical protein
MNDEDEDHEGSEEKECVICMDDFWYLPPPSDYQSAEAIPLITRSVRRSVVQVAGQAGLRAQVRLPLLQALPAQQLRRVPHTSSQVSFPSFSSFSFLCFFVVLVRLVNDGQVLKLTCPNPTCAAPVRASHS